MTSERFTTKENEQILKEVKPQEVNSLVQTPRSDDPVSGNSLREHIQNFETLEKEIQFRKVCEDASFWKRVSIGVCHKTVLDVDDGFGDRTPACREYTLLRANSDSRCFAMIPGQTTIGPVLQVHMKQFLGTHGIEIQMLSTTMKERTSWVVIYRGKSCFVRMSYISEIQDTIPRVLNFFWKDRLKKKVNLFSTELEQSRIEETHATQLEIQTNPVYLFKRSYSYKFFKGNTLSAEISKLVMRLVRRYDQDERETDGAVPWSSMGPKLRKAFQKAGGR